MEKRVPNLESRPILSFHMRKVVLNSKYLIVSHEIIQL